MRPSRSGSCSLAIVGKRTSCTWRDPASADGLFPGRHLHYVYARDTALHVAAAGHRPDSPRHSSPLAPRPRKNRRGAQPLHYAADSRPGAANWNPDAQAATVAYSSRQAPIPMHRQQRRCAAASCGPDSWRCCRACSAGWRRRCPAPESQRVNPCALATQTTGKWRRHAAAKAEQREILRLLELPPR